MVSAPLKWCWLGRMAYEDALALQHALTAARERGEESDTLLLLEHEPVYTMGRRAAQQELLWDERERAARGIALSRTERGGKLTYHGPGQLVGYPIVDIRARGLGVRAWVETIEHALIDYLKRFDIVGRIECGHPGVWVGEQKIAAIGLHISRGVSRHGFALNVSTDLGAYAGIVACGVNNAPASIESLRGSAPPVGEIAADVARALAEKLGAPLQAAAAVEVRKLVA